MLGVHLHLKTWIALWGPRRCPAAVPVPSSLGVLVRVCAHGGGSSICRETATGFLLISWAPGGLSLAVREAQGLAGPHPCLSF